MPRMGTLTSQPYDVAEGEAYCAYLERITGECRRLMTEGRMPDSETTDAFLSDVGRIVRQVRLDTATARSRGERTICSAISMTNEERKRLDSLSESMLNLLQILELRGAVVLDRTDAVSRVAAAFAGADFAL